MRREPKTDAEMSQNAFWQCTSHNSSKSNECLTEFRARRVSHPAYSPDLALSDFFLFGTVKAELQNYEIHSKEDLILAIRAIFDQISQETLISIYFSWIERLKWVTTNGRKHFHKWLKNNDFLFEIYRKKWACTDFSTPR
jgi:hypothetical protein